MERTLRWWSSTLRRDTRAERGSPPIEPIAIELVPSAPTFASSGGPIEIAVGRTRLHVEVGTDVAYIAPLVRELGEERWRSVVAPALGARVHHATQDADGVLGWPAVLAKRGFVWVFSIR